MSVGIVSFWQKLMAAYWNDFLFKLCLVLSCSRSALCDYHFHSRESLPETIHLSKHHIIIQDVTDYGYWVRYVAKSLLDCMWVCAFFFSTQLVLCHWVLTLPFCSVSGKPGGSENGISKIQIFSPNACIQSSLLLDGYNMKISSRRQKKKKHSSYFHQICETGLQHRQFSTFSLTSMKAPSHSGD